MKKMLFVLFMSIFVLTGCSKEVTGTYLNIEDENFYLKLYNEGKCDWKYGNGLLQKTKDGDCSYDYNNDEVIITFTDILDIIGDGIEEVTCTRDGKKLDCGIKYGEYEIQK